MAEQLANLATTTLAGSMDSSTTSLVVTDASKFPTSGVFRVVVDGEIMTVTGVSGTTFTVVRAQGGTVAADHISSARVSAVITKEGLLAYLGDRLIIDTYANKPAAGNKGRIFLASDSLIKAYDDGTNWLHEAYGHRITPPDFTGFGWINQGASTLSVTRGFARFNVPVSATNNLRMYTKAYTPNKTVTMAFNWFIEEKDFFYAGIVIRNNTSGKAIIFVVAFDTANSKGDSIKPLVFKFDSPVTFNSEGITTPKYSSMVGLPLFWLRVEDDNTNLKFSVSPNGLDWDEIFSEPRTTYLTPEQIGVIVNSANSSPGTINVFSWLEE